MKIGDIDLEKFIESANGARKFYWLWNSVAVILAIIGSGFTIYSVISGKIYYWIVVIICIIMIALLAWNIKQRSVGRKSIILIIELEKRLSALGSQHKNTNYLNDSLKLFMQLEEQFLRALAFAENSNERQRLYTVYLEQANIYNQSLLESERLNSNG